METCAGVSSNGVACQKHCVQRDVQSPLSPCLLKACGRTNLKVWGRTNVNAAHVCTNLWHARRLALYECTPSSGLKEQTAYRVLTLNESKSAAKRHAHPFHIPIQVSTATLEQTPPWQVPVGAV